MSEPLMNESLHDLLDRAGVSREALQDSDFEMRWTLLDYVPSGWTLLARTGGITLAKAVTHAGETFRHYARVHRAKGTANGLAKAGINDELAAYQRGGHELEPALHKQFRQYRSHGEWFRFVGPVFETAQAWAAESLRHSAGQTLRAGDKLQREATL